MQGLVVVHFHFYQFLDNSPKDGLIIRFDVLQTSQHWPQMSPYLSHCVVFHSYFPEEEVDIISIIHCLDKVWFCGQIVTLVGYRPLS